MKSLLMPQYKQLELAELPVPDVGPDDVLVQIAACGICGSDVHGFDGSSGRRIPPIVMGHEAAGQVERVGDQVTRFAAGDRVTFDSTVSCGQCRFCKDGQENLCDDRRVLGVSCDEYRQHGAFAEFVAVPEHVVYSLPDDLAFEHAALVEPVSVAVHAVKRIGLTGGEDAVVVGAGMIGLLVVQALRAAGCGRVWAVDLDDGRLELAKQLGAESGFNPARDNVPDLVNRETAGRGADVAVEVVGATEPLATAIGCVRKGGKVSLVGNLAAHVGFPLQAVVTRELTLLGSCASSGDYPESIQMIADGRINVAPLISATASLEEGPAYFRRLYAREAGLMKVVLKP